MLLRNSTKINPFELQSSVSLCKNFQKAVSFIEWSEFESQSLHKFEQMLLKEIRVCKQQLCFFLVPLKLDHQLNKNLKKMCQEIENNLNNFSLYGFQQYHNHLQSKALFRVNLLFRTSSQMAKYICHSLMFLHFASCNVRHYNKMINWFEGKQLQTKLEQWKEPSTSVFIKQKVYTVVSLCYIKINLGHRKSTLINQAINLRQAYIHHKVALEPNSHNLGTRKTISISLVPDIFSETITSDGKITEESKIDKRRLQLYYQVTTLFLRYKLIKSLVVSQQGQIAKTSNNLMHALTSNKIKKQSISTKMHIEPQPHKYYETLTLIYKFISDIKKKEQEGLKQLQSQVQFFKFQINQLMVIHQSNLKKIEDSLYEEYKECEQNHNSPFEHEIQNQKVDLETEFQEHPDLPQKKNQNKFRAQSLCLHQRSLSKDNTKIKEELNEKYFKNNNMVQNKSRVKSAKYLFRDRSKSKVMSKILASTFQNAKNALRQIQFQIKSRKYQAKNEKTDEPKSKLMKRKKKDSQLYGNLNKGNQMIVNVCRNKLDEEIKKIRDVVICNPLLLIDENKKCIIEHRIIHKDHNENNLFDIIVPHQQNQSEGFSSEVKTGYEVIKYINGRPQIICIKIKLKERNYIVGLDFLDESMQSLNCQISLPKSNNIYPGRYHTIWPTIKYLLTKKLLKLSIFKQLEASMFEQNRHQERKRVVIKEDSVIHLFGLIDEDEFSQICRTFTIIAKFFDLLLYSEIGILGRRAKLCELSNPSELVPNKKSCPTKKQEHSRMLQSIKNQIQISHRKTVFIAGGLVKLRILKSSLIEHGSPFFIFQLAAKIQNMGESSNFVTVALRLYSTCPEKLRNKTEYNNCVYQQKANLLLNNITLNEVSIKQYNLNVWRIISGTKPNSYFQFKMLQKCWLVFKLNEDFHTPDFFNYQCSRIMPLNIKRVQSQGTFKTFECSSKSGTGSFIPKIYDNFVQFNLDEQLCATSHSFVKNGTSKMILPSQKQVPMSNRYRFINQLTSINSVIQSKKVSLTTKKQHRNRQKQQTRYTFINLKERKNVQVVVIQFITPFSPIDNWLARINVKVINKCKAYQIVVSAEDLYILGSKNLGQISIALKQLQKLAKCLSLNFTFQVPKLIIQIQPELNGNTSIEACYRKPTISILNNQEASNFQEKQPNAFSVLRFRSTYLNKNYRQQNIISNNLSYFQTSGSLHDPKTREIIRHSQKTQNRHSNQFSSTVYNNNNNKSIMENEKAKSRLKRFLAQLQQFQIYFSTVPFKFSSGFNKKEGHLLDNIYSLISLKCIDLYFHSLNSSFAGKQTIEIEVSFLQTEYTLITHVKQKQFFEHIEKLSPQFQERYYDFIRQAKADKKTGPESIISSKERKPIRSRQKNRNTKISFLSDCVQTDFYLTEQQSQLRQRKEKLKNNQKAPIIKKKCNKIVKQTSLKGCKQIFKNLMLKGRLRILKQQEHCEFLRNQMLRCSRCSSNQGIHYGFEIGSLKLPLQFRVYQFYDSAQVCIFDVYLHSKNFEIGVGVNSGIGLDAQIQTAMVHQDDHFQLVRIKRKVKNKRTSLDSSSKLNQSNTENKSKYMYRSPVGAFRHNFIQDNEGNQVIVEQIATERILQLFERYKFEHIDPAFQMQPDLYLKGTIFLTKIAKYMVDIYSKKPASLKGRQI